YKTIVTEAIPLEVTADKSGGGGANNNYISQEAKTPPSAPKEPELRFLKPWDESAGLPRAIPFLLLAVNLALAIYLAARKISVQRLVERMAKSPRRRLATLFAEARRSPDHYAGLEKCLYGAMEILLGRAALGMTREEMAEAWKGRQLPPALLHKIQSLFDAADRERFAARGAAAAADAEKNLQILRDAIEESIRLVK
ncbi:MAG: hypothetical protein HUU37_11280, partial [Bdellovibrionales bacterium]|nr:hypothetical protein [Bdellovibrionales bacterium]